MTSQQLNRMPEYLPVSSVAATLTSRSHSLKGGRAAGADFYSFELEGWPYSPAEIRQIDDDGSGVQIGASMVVGSGHFMTLRIFDPATGRLWHLGDNLGLGDGRYSLLLLRGGLPFAVLVSDRDGGR